MDKTKLKNAFCKAKKLDYTNGMATKSIDIKTDMGDISIIKKTNMRMGEFFLIRIKENQELGHMEPNKTEIEENIKHVTDLRGFDVNVKFKSHVNDYKYSCILPVKIFNL